MALSQSVCYKAAVDEVWGLVVRTVSLAGYSIARTDSAAKEIVYDVPMQLAHAAQLVEVSVTDIGEEETLVTIVVRHKLGEALINLGKRYQRELSDYVIAELDRKYTKIVHEAQASVPPGASGCMLAVICTCFVLTLAWTIYTLVA